MNGMRVFQRRHIAVPTKNAKEIIEKLKKDNNIVSINERETATEVEVNESVESLRRLFRF